MVFYVMISLDTFLLFSSDLAGIARIPLRGFFAPPIHTINRAKHTLTAIHSGVLFNRNWAAFYESPSLKEYNHHSGAGSSNLPEGVVRDLFC